MIPILDWIFEGVVGWVSSIASQLLDAVSGLFLEALGTDMTAMEEYFPFVTKAYGVMQVTAYAITGCRPQTMCHGTAHGQTK